jgi:hypothetical protein
MTKNGMFKKLDDSYNFGEKVGTGVRFWAVDFTRAIITVLILAVFGGLYILYGFVRGLKK